MTKFYEIKGEAGKAATLWLFGFIGNSIWDEINPMKVIDELKEYGNLDQINVHINSQGGSVIGGNAIYNALKSNPAKVVVHVEGIAASMGSVIAMAGDEVHMPDNAMLMIHDPWTYADGNAEQLRKIADQLDKAKATLLTSYVKKTGLSEDEISGMMTAETWMTAAEALELGFADFVGEPIDIAASVRNLDLSNFNNAPESLFSNQSAKPDTTKEENAMSDKDKSNPQASAESGKTKTPVTEPVAALSENDLQAKIDAAAEAKAKQLMALEQARKNAVAKVFAPFGTAFDTLKAECLGDSEVTQAKAQELLLAKIGESSEPLGRSVTVIEDRSDKIKSAFESAIMARAGLVSGNERNEYRGYPLAEMARECLHAYGVGTRSMDRLEMVGAAFTHSSGDFPKLLQNVMHKTMLKGWDEAPETYQEWTSKGTLTDFKPAQRVDLNSYPALAKVLPGAEYKYATIGERGETTQLATYGSLISFNRQTIINDDLDAFSKIPMKMGRAARRTIGNLVYAILTGNPSMSDGTELFHADHNNLGTGVLSTASIDALRVLMAKQTDGTANALGITPSFLIVPEALKGAAMVLMESETEIAASQNNSKKPNSVRNIAKVISDARLDAASAVIHYMVASPSMFDTIEVSYLDGVEAPFLDQMQGWTIDGTEFKVRIDAGVKALDFRTMARGSGA